MRPLATDVGLQVAGTWKPCDRCRGSGLLEGYANGPEKGVTGTSKCGVCKGTSRISALPVVRVPCGCDHGDYCLKNKDGNCRGCAGRGWTPSTDLAVWIEALEAAFPDSHVEHRHGLWYILLSCVPEPITSDWHSKPWYGAPLFMDALSQALVAGGGTLHE